MSRSKRGAHRPKRRRKLVAVVVVLGLLAVVLGGASAAGYAYDQSRSGRILPGVTIAGVDVGGLTRAQSIRRITPVVDQALSRTIVVTAGGRTWTITPRELGVRAQIDLAENQAFAVSGSMSWLERVYHRVRGVPVVRSIPIAYRMDPAAVRSFVGQVAHAVARPARDASIGLDSNEMSVVEVHSRDGRALRPILSVHLLMRTLRDPTPEVTLPVLTIVPSSSTLGRTITVDVSTNTLKLYDGLGVIRTFPVATAQFGFTTPDGTWQVARKELHPTWYNPGSPWAASMPPIIPPGPDNPLGLRALALSVPGILIHGTPETSSIGTYASHGCIRMYEQDALALYPLVPTGTPVLIFGAPPWGNTGGNGVAGF